MTFLLSFLILTGLVGNSQNDCSLIAEFKNTKFTIIKDTQNLPMEIKEYFHKQFKREFAMANPAGYFAYTDIITPGLADERLIFLDIIQKRICLFYTFKRLKISATQIFCL